MALGGKGGDDIENMSDVGGLAEDLLPDRVFGGAGNDSISVSQELGGDRVDCGAGRRDDVCGWSRRTWRGPARTSTGASRSA